ncbi:hypothetical protein EHQ92_08490 [Leptospira biflexa]|uniref:hypothetical protein n=1 Tax=Leptospira biflexa TaxID=172 RepID=UPI001083273C|nr:hypothetical protein [Leptospira biflexa]TGM35175.1 hypothetical protein EHQ89_11935 [Leptospira biflexa]TGM38390.1 hypothetical protein EHQ80_12675 [Leptospira biflexa]TGM47927.1 hypothetical protein EHQ92_08490 [Leptospira biflexa]TGM49608.1 hypothetical protein EHQ88_04595 [Leptospira biflexa]
MRKFQKTYELTVSLEHLPIQETKLQQLVLEWEEFGFPFWNPFQVFDWKTKPEPLSHSSISFVLFQNLTFLESITYYLFPTWFTKQKLNHLTNILREKLGIGTRPIQNPSILKTITRWWKEPVKLYLGNLEIVQTRMEMLGIQNPTGFRHIQIHSGESQILFRIGYLKAIQYRFSLKKFKAPFPKLAECYIKTRDSHMDKSFGRVYDSFLGYLLETTSDEHLLEYFGLRPLVPNSIRELIPIEIWNQTTPLQNSDWVLTNLNAEELQFRTVYQVSTFSPHHLK